MIKECEFLQHWRLGWSKVPELSLSFGELFSPDGGVVRPWGLGPKLDQTLETWGLLDVHTTFDDEICLSGTRSGQGSTLWALLGGGKSDFGQRNGLKPDPQTLCPSRGGLLGVKTPFFLAMKIRAPLEGPFRGLFGTGPTFTVRGPGNELGASKVQKRATLRPPSAC